MGPAYFLIAILGCADGGTACTQVATLRTRYSTQEQCAAATAGALIDNSSFDFPTLVASCRKSDTMSAEVQEQRRDRRHGS